MTELHITHAHVRRLMEELWPKCYKKPRFRSRPPDHVIPASAVFDALRELCVPTMTKDEFNQIANDIDKEQP